ncbi:hypothetical protein RAB80_016451 [Fusarium oxysporum f. sp. vasinfectum]|uniref:Uncharacterized protein n=1 Tax=Fusarium oxysporum f. sp. vasinfectum 25433 TaxID=1089449 RepID=X0KL64_FUSOX|nr:hypothetical protein FOTG_17264 [Fusarium oxysporum f. sp. vasinfectum 25433]KAK2667260.1 hypothetical protein RAB80_016451 [Fusarium oxysporum f. sp. vasinfectum]KAK2931874.1 hypothetical protein FoTM2_009392 [Fusarium oxysporum f. sp. vasinfectum]
MSNLSFDADRIEISESLAHSARVAMKTGEPSMHHAIITSGTPSYVLGDSDKLVKVAPAKLLAMTYEEAYGTGAPLLSAVGFPAGAPVPQSTTTDDRTPQPDLFPELKNKYFAILNTGLRLETAVPHKGGSRGDYRSLVGFTGKALRASTTNTVLTISPQDLNDLSQEAREALRKERKRQSKNMVDKDRYVWIDHNGNYVIELLGIQMRDARSEWLGSIAPLLATKTVKIYLHRTDTRFMDFTGRIAHKHIEVRALTEGVLALRQYNDVVGLGTLFSYSPETVAQDLRAHPKLDDFLGPIVHDYLVDCIVNEVQSKLENGTRPGITILKALRDLLIANYRRNEHFEFYIRDRVHFDDKIRRLSDKIVHSGNKRSTKWLPLLLIKKSVIFSAIAGMVVDTASANESHQTYTIGLIESVLRGAFMMAKDAPMGNVIKSLGTSTTDYVFKIVNPNISNTCQKSLDDVVARFDNEVFQPGQQGYVTDEVSKKKMGEGAAEWANEAKKIFTEYLKPDGIECISRPR